MRLVICLSGSSVFCGSRLLWTLDPFTDFPVAWGSPANTSTLESTQAGGIGATGCGTTKSALSV